MGASSRDAPVFIFGLFLYEASNILYMEVQFNSSRGGLQMRITFSGSLSFPGAIWD